MRTLSRFGAVCAAASAALLFAPAAHATAPGDNGTVKIHDAATGEELTRNEPHVCAFYLDAFGFDGGQKVDWHIDAIPPSENKGETVESGVLSLDAEGHGRTEDLSLADGHYKLFWTFEGEKGSAKHKVFWSDCEDEQEPGGSTPSGSASASASPSSGVSGSPSGGPGASASPSASAGGGVPASASPSSSPSPQGGGDGDLAETGNGAPVGVLSGVAAALVAGGGFLVLRRRRAGRG
ncbi:LPXTG-domain-containing protein cell wall anchor domain protein [Streptomyces sp. NRRL B-1140]|uniref:LPXTG cell wall anchor domain-containing protein n=1 Tax=Streptomyces sp. NRRL B-1140 TaxID=1415549 RepID=UPI0006AFB216|nr:LPXTG cell wall anchor domain-containing protein [Streptomyces sp. NRRL B-1140]KOV90929.1 LPXTG-domain-containing protein cell wall anchor domain protein [Streptomyces sp. NRRL B-1140]